MLYKIKPGYSFLDADGSTKTGGESIDLGDEFAATHADKVDALGTDTTSPASDAYQHNNEA